MFSAANVMVTMLIVWLTDKSSEPAGSVDKSEATSCENVPLLVRLVVIEGIGRLMSAPRALLRRLGFKCQVPLFREEESATRHSAAHRRLRRGIARAVTRAEEDLISRAVSGPQKRPIRCDPINQNETEADESETEHREGHTEFTTLQADAANRTTENSSQMKASAIRAKQGIPLVAYRSESSTGTGTDPINELLSEMRLLNLHMNYLSLKKLHNSSASCRFVRMHAIPGELKANTSLGNNNVKQREGERPKERRLPKRSKSSVLEASWRRRSASWEQVAAVLNSFWGLVYIVLSLANFIYYLLPLLRNASQESVHPDTSRLGC